MHDGKPLRIALVLAFLAVPELGRAQEILGGNLAAMGGAATAHPADNAGITSNPGILGLTERYDLQGHLTIGPDDHLEFGVSALDARTSTVALGLSWRRTLDEPPLTTEDLPGWVVPGRPIPNVKRGHEVSAAVAVPIEDRRYSFGVGGTLRTGVDDRGGHHLAGNLHVGAGARVERWTFGLAGRNLLPLPDQEALPSSIAAGVFFREEALASWALEVGANLDEDPFFVGTGVELLTGSFRPRLGYRYESRAHWLTGGFGIENEIGALEYGLGLPLTGPLHLGGLVHTVGLRAHL